MHHYIYNIVMRTSAPLLAVALAFYGFLRKIRRRDFCLSHAVNESCLCLCCFGSSMFGVSNSNCRR